MSSEEKVRSRAAAGSVGTVQILGVPVRLHFTFILLLVFLLFIGIGGKQSGAMTALYILGLFASVLLHELGHTLAARHYGIRTTEIVMYPIGGVSRPERPPVAREELPIALAGPLVNLLIACVLAGLVASQQGFVALERLMEPTDANLAERLALGNLMLFLFNLLPAYPMDGGRILRSLLALRMPQDRATRIAASAGQWLAILMGLAGLLWGNFILMFVALFVYLGAFQEGALARGRQFTAGYPVRAAMMTDFRTVEHGQTIRDAGNLLLTTSQHDFPVVHGTSVVGLLTRAALVRAMLNEGPDGYVAGAMDRDFIKLKPDTPLTEALPQISTPGACALVMDDDGKLLGILTSEKLSEFLLLRQAAEAQHRIHPA
ncbi:MAG TPA: site-2 protease family protein [Bryobacteraceae bacterium]|nr:site-2 protease family protein [Bryobacteraceae bacterium]